MKKLVDIYLNTIKSKVKEKNINNEIAKHNFHCFKSQSKRAFSENEISFTIVKTGDYSVASQYSQTLSNEKKLINVLTDDVTENILDTIALKLNDL